jgi:mono/diheme cytochrome c family protein
MAKIITFLCFSVLLLLLSNCGNEATYAEGKTLYDQHCLNCHMEDGKGLGELYPPLAGADMLKASGAGAACWIRNGLKGPIKVNGIEYDNVMTANKHLSAIEITNILNYVNNAWGNKRDFITLDEVMTALEGCEEE